MKLNPSCVRDILLFIENNNSPDGTVQFVFEDKYGTYELLHEDECPELTKNIFEPFSNYSDDEIIYHLRQCEMSGLIGETHFVGNTCEVEDLTPLGHEFLANIRSDGVWKRIVDKGTASLPVLFELAKDLALKYYLG